SGDVAQHFATDTGSARLAVRHHAAGRGHDCHAQAIHDLRNVVAALVDTETRPADALQAFNHRTAGVVLQTDLEFRFACIALDGVGIDVALVLQDLGDRDFQLRRRHHNAGFLDHLCVADASQHVGDGITHAHWISPVRARGAGLPAGLDDTGDVALEGQLTNLVARETELAERATGTAREFATVAQAGRVRVARQLLQLQASRVALFVRLVRVVDDRLQLRVLLRELGDQLLALYFTLLDRQFCHGSPQFLNGNLNAASSALHSS